MSIPVVTGFFESRTSSIQYVVADPQTKHAAIIDPVLDFDPKSGDTDTVSADELLGYIARKGYTLEWITPGHTLASIAYIIADCAFIHDTIFMPDGGTARADFPGGSARALWHSIGRIMSLPDATRLFTGHDYMPGGREPLWESTVAEQRAKNIHLTKAKLGPIEGNRRYPVRDPGLCLARADPGHARHALRRLCAGRRRLRVSSGIHGRREASTHLVASRGRLARHFGRDRHLPVARR